MTNYAQQELAIQKFIPDALNAFYEEYAELTLSLDKLDLVDKLISYLRLQAVNLPPIAQDNALDIVAQAIGALLATGRLKPQSYGFSPRGEFEADSLAGKYSVTKPPEKKAPPTPREKYADIVNDWNTLSSAELSAKKKNSAWLDRFNAAVAAGVIR